MLILCLISAVDTPDLFDELSESQQHDVLEGIAEADRGEVNPFFKPRLRYQT